MKKLASTFTSMFLVLGGVSVLAAAALASVQKLTEEPIRKAALAAQETAIKAVVPAFDNSPVEEQYWLPTSEGDNLSCFPASKKGELLGVAIESYSRNGYGGLIKVMVGLEPDGRVHGFSVLSHAETPGLGSKMETWFKTNKPGQYVPGLHPAETELRVRKDGGDVDAITAATITSRAFLEAINLAYETYAHQLEVKAKGLSEANDDTDDGETGATTPTGTTPKAVDTPKSVEKMVEHPVETPNTPKESTEADGVSGASQSY